MSPRPFSPSSSLFRWLPWVRAAPLPLLALGLPLAAWRAGADTVPPTSAPSAEVRACQQRVARGYATSGIQISAEDALTISAACQRLARERIERTGEELPSGG